MSLVRPMVVAALLVGVAYGQESTNLSPQEADARSRVHFQLGRGHLQLKEYDDAIREFEIGYRFKPLPLFLYNIAQVAVLAGQKQKALDYYERYLTASPKAPERAEVTQRIAQLKREVAAEPPGAAASDEPTPSGEPATPPAGTTGSSTSTAQSTNATSPALIGLSPTDTQTTKPQSRHRALWIALGVVSGAALVGGVIALGVTLSSKSDNTGYNDWGTLVVTPR
jgi:tetratricopeptide (TPR) repeat protein